MKPSDWDARLVPRLARRTQRCVVAVRRLVGSLAGPTTPAGQAMRGEPALAASIVAALLAGVLLAAAGGPGGPPDSGESAPTSGTDVPVPVTTSLGPTPGTSVSGYVARAAADLRRFAAAAHGRQGFAVIDLASYRDPHATASLFTGVPVVRAYVRVPGSGLPTQVHAIPLQGSFGLLADGMQASGRLAAATGHTFGILVAQMRPRTAQDYALRGKYAVQERASAYEAQRLARPAQCGCVFAVVVRADATVLRRLARTRGVRVVDAAPPGATLDTLTIFPLEPEITAVVPRGGLFGG